MVRTMSGGAKIKVAELFAGVGGFRLGLEGPHYEVVFSNQYEPSTKAQHASEVYEARFGSDGHSREDINALVTRDVEEIPNHDLLVGGFPCQDYSVATTLHNSKGLRGKKGVLWWSIYKILEAKKNPPKYLLLENVDRLLKSPAAQRGRDFAVMLKGLDDLGYAVEWRVINAADYGMPQRRRRIFFVAYHKSTAIYKNMAIAADMTEGTTLINAFPATFVGPLSCLLLEGDLLHISNDFNKGGKLSPFSNFGVMIDGVVKTLKVKPNYDGPKAVLGDVLQDGPVGAEFYLAPETMEKWDYLKGAKSIDRVSATGFAYKYTEGAMIYPDALTNASRTIITGEGGAGPSRFKHVVETDAGRRRLTPLELERLNMFPDNHTKLEGISDTKRAFFMGNALVVGVIRRIGTALARNIEASK